VDPSALIFVALAVAWAAYLLPQALRHHDQAKRTRSVERFSERMRVLARREPTSSRNARLVVTPGRAPSRPVVETKASAKPATSKVSAAARRAAAQQAARRRRNVLSAILLVLVVVAGLSLGGLFSPWWNAAPTGVLVAWLVACRLMVKKERRARAGRPSYVLPTTAIPPRVEEHDLAPTRVFLPVPSDEVLVDPATPVVPMPDPVLDDGDPSRWDLRPVTLPTYVSKAPAAQRSVRTIDLESTGVWTSGRTEIDAELARAAEAERKAERTTAAQADVEHRATGS